MGNFLSMLKPYSTKATEEETTSLFPFKPDVTLDSFNIQVGRSIDAQTIRIPRCVLGLCPVLKAHVVPGCKIINSDAAVLEIFIEHLQHHSILGLTTFSAPGHLEELTLGDDPLLNFSKAWHLADLLRMPELQNVILKIYSAYYKTWLEHPRFLKEIVPFDPRPFTYLRDTLGNDTKPELFLTDFHAGLVKRHTEFRKRYFKLLPEDVSLAIRQRWEELRARRDSSQSSHGHDRILSHSGCFYVDPSAPAHHSALQIQYLCEAAGPGFGFNPPVPSLGARGNIPYARLDVLVNKRVYRDMRSHSVNSRGFAGLIAPRDENGRRKPRFDSPFVSSRSRRRGLVFLDESEAAAEGEFAALRDEVVDDGPQ